MPTMGILGFERICANKFTESINRLSWVFLFLLTSTRVTFTPFSARKYAASDPASPAPITNTFLSIEFSIFFRQICPRYRIFKPSGLLLIWHISSMRHEKGIYMKFILHQQDITIGDLEKACDLITSSNHPESNNNETHLHLWHRDVFRWLPAARHRFG